MNRPFAKPSLGRRTRLLATVGAILGLLGSASCGAGRPKDNVVESEHFTLFYNDGTTPCDSLLDELEAHRAATLNWLGLSDVPHIHYYLYEDKEQLKRGSPCARCTVEAKGHVEIHTERGGLDEHELIHAYTITRGSPPDVLQEGLAESLDCFPGAAINAPRMSLDDLLDFVPNTEHYTAAAFLVRYLIMSYGTERFLEFYWSQVGESIADLPAALEKFFGSPLDEVWETAKGVPRWQVLSCVCPESELDPSVRTFNSGGEGCGFLNRGRFKSNGDPVLVAGLNRSQSPLRLVSCFGETWAPGGNLYLTGSYRMPSGPVTETLIATLPLGDYAVIPDSGKNNDYDFSVSPAIGWSESCNIDLPLPVEVNADQASQLSVVTRTDGYLAIQTSSSAVRTIQGELPASDDVALCSDCSPEASCEATFDGEHPTIWGPIEGSDFTKRLEISAIRE